MEVAAASVFEGQAERLKPYVPRLLIEWVRDAPDECFQVRDGTLAFVDISGFTALTERLAGRGKIGAEVLRDTLDGVFTSLLAEAYLWGAGLLKFSGDAVLLLFDGDEHPWRAARAVWEMQRTIERVGRIREGSSMITLRMSVGVATGPIDFFTAGSLHRELLLVGPVATETVLMEGIADAGEIALTPELASILGPACVGPLKGDAVLLGARPEAPLVQAPDVGDVDAAMVAQCIPKAAREHVLLEHSEPEHRVITAVFVELMETDALLERVGPAAFAEALDDRISWIEEVADRYEVPFNATDIAKGAVRVLLSAGAPSSTGHDEEQVLRMARELMDRPGAIPMRIGANTGRVFTGDFGPPYRRTYATLGDATNTAARVMVRAEPGQILVTEEVLRRSRTIFETTPIEPFRAKGKAEPVRASLVGPIVGRRRERLSETPFVGRERELATLRGVLGEVRAGNGWTVEVEGPSGIGKTRLLRELLDGAPDFRELRSTCEEYEGATAYYAMRAPLRDVLGLAPHSTPKQAERRLRKVVARIAPQLEDWLPLLGVVLGLDLPPTDSTAALDERFFREVLADVVLRFLFAAVDAKATALVVEDAQFADAASADLLSLIAAAAASSPLLIVVARTHKSSSWHDVTTSDGLALAFDLLPLPDSAASELVELATDEEPMRPHDIEGIVRRSGGSPLFLIELLNVARAMGTAEALPDSIEAAVTAEIDRLAPLDRTALRYASVLGVAFEAELLATTLREEVTLDEAIWSRLRGFLERESAAVLRFRNTLVRDVAYEGLPFRRRRELHARVAEAIEASTGSLEDDAATLALHFSAAHRHEPTWRYARIGGDLARTVAANVDAARLYELALHAGRHLRSVRPRDRAEVLVSLGVVYETSGMFDASFEALRRAGRVLTAEPVERARVHSLRALARIRVGSPVLALRETATGLRLIDGIDSLEAIRAQAALWSMRAQVRGMQGHAREAVALADLAVDAAKRSNEPEALGRAYGVLDEAYRTLGEHDKVVHGRLALELYRELGQTRRAGLFEMNLGHQAQWAGRWDEAVELLRQAQEDCSASGDRQAAAGAGVVLGEVLVNRGSLSEAEIVLRDARRVLRATGIIPYALLAETQLSRIALARGQAEDAFESLGRSYEAMELVGQAGFALEVAIHFAEAARAAGDASRGLTVLEAAARRAGEEAILWAAPVERMRGALLGALGRLDEASACLDRALAHAREQSIPYEELLALRGRAELAVASGHEPDSEELRESEGLAQLLGIRS
jgi:class 3 adenylate cyclase/tetratricopeptide (TPR) repeat protein